MFFDAFAPMPLFAQAAPAGGGLPQMLLLFAAFGGIFYFLLFRPQQQQRKKHAEMIDAVKRGDEVILQGGLHGKVTKVGDDIIEVEIAKDVVIKQVKSMVLTVSGKPEPQSKKKPEAEAKKK